MNRTAYYAARRAARLADRRRFIRKEHRYCAAQDSYEADRAYFAAVRAIPGGLTRPLSHIEAQIGLGIPEWQLRRQRVHQMLAERRNRARIAAALELVTEFLSPNRMRSAA